MTLLRVAGISVEEEGTTILDNISFSQAKGRKIALAGETGSGKSTLMQTIAGFVQPSAGAVYLNDKKVRGPHDRLVPGHADIAYLSQEFELPQFLRVEQVLQYSNKLSSEEARQLYDVCRISHLAKRRTNQASGGERQRIALARLLSTWPDLLLLDEPFSNLDMAHKKVLKSVIHDISQELGITCILISHDPLDTLSWADEIMVLQQGKLIQRSSPDQLYKGPVNEYAASLFGKYNLVPVAAASSLFNLSVPENKQLLLRPEGIKLAAKSGVPATISSIHYFGSYYELEVQTAEILLLLRTGSAEYQVGDTVYLELDEKAVWWV